MFLIYGRRTANIRNYTSHNYPCQNCKDFDLEIKVYREYFHVFFIPIFPTSFKDVKIRCNNCGQLKWIDSLQKQYKESIKAPFYLYAGLIIIAGLILWISVANRNTQKEKAAFVASPRTGDVYTIRNEESNTTTYYFLKVSRINGDTIYTYHNTLEYSKFVSKFNDGDFFTAEEEVIYTKKELQEMLDKGEINSVERNYGTDKGFDRIR